MPKVPTYDSPSVQSRGIPNASIRTGGVSAEAFGAGLGRAMESGGQVLMKVGQAIDQANEKKAVADGMDASDTLNQEWNAKQQEFSQLKGKDAANVQKDMGAWYDKRAAEIGGGLEDERARRLFDRNAKRLRMSADDWAFSYQEKQGDVYFNATMESNIKSAQQSAIFNPTSENIAQQVGITHEIYRDIALRKGLDADWVNQNTEAMRQGLYGDILKNAMQQDAVGSVSSFIEEHGDSIDPGLRGQAEKWVHNKQIGDMADSYADTLLNSGVGIEDAITGAMERFQGEDRDKYVSAIKQRYALREYTKNAEEKQLTEKIYADVYKNPMGIASLSDEQIDNLAQYNPRLAIDLKDKKQAYLDVLAKGGQFANETDADTNLSLTNDILDGKIKDVNQLTMYRGKLSEGDYNKAKTLIEKQGLLSDSGADEAYRNFFPKPKDQDSDVKKYADLVRRAQFMIDAAAYVKETHRNQDLAGFAANWALKGKVPIEGSGFEIGGKRYFEKSKTVTAGEAAAAGDAGSFTPDKPLERDALTASYIDNINNIASQKQKQNDEALKQKAKQKLMDAGQPVTAQRVQKLVDDMKAAQ